MNLKAKLKAKNLAALLFSIFYAIAGVVFLSVFVVYDLNLVFVAVVGILSLIAAYGIFGMEKWAVWLVVALFVLGNAFGIPILVASSSWPATLGLLLESLLIIYLIITWVTSVYVIVKREKFSMRTEKGTL